MAHTAVLSALPSIFHHLRMTDTYFKKNPKVLTSAEFYTWYTYTYAKQQQISQEMDFLLQYF